MPGFVLSNAFLKNQQFRNFDEFRKFSEAEIFPVYLYLRLASEEKFGIILKQKDSAFIDSLKRDFEVLSSERFDLNYVSPEASGYKERLIRRFYLLERKN